MKSKSWQQIRCWKLLEMLRPCGTATPVDLESSWTYILIVATRFVAPLYRPTCLRSPESLARLLVKDRTMSSIKLVFPMAPNIHTVLSDRLDMPICTLIQIPSLFSTSLLYLSKLSLNYMPRICRCHLQPYSCKNLYSATYKTWFEC